jgi:molecular chaperone GrpE
MTEEKRDLEEEMKAPEENTEECEKDAQKGAEEPTEASEEPASAEAEDSASEKVEDAQEKAEKLVVELSSQLLRLQADFQNYKRRTQEDRASDIEFANKKLATALLDVIDNFERALGSECTDEKFKEGMELILKQLMTVLEKNNIKPIEAERKQFDPNFHNAVQMLPSEDAESGTVITVLQKGYTLNDKLIRPAMVIVAQ